MDESAPMKAIMIGAGLFITIVTITAVLNYYATAKEMVQSIGTGVDYLQEYSDYIQSILLKANTDATITGTEVKNLLNYFYHNERVTIRIGNARPLYKEDGSQVTKNDHIIRAVVDNVNNLQNNNDNVFNEFQKKIVPAQEFTISKAENNGLEIILTGK